MQKYLICFLFVLLVSASLINLPVHAQCTGEEECYATPVPADQQSSRSGWPPDDRLNPVQDEYYTIYCHFDQIEVWRGVGGSVQLAAIPISRVMMSVQPFDSSGLRVSRSDNVVTISGANGNGPHHPGSKSFTLIECIERNGGAPADTQVVNGPEVGSVVSVTCTYYFGDLPVALHPLPVQSSAPSTLDGNGNCRRPLPGAYCHYEGELALTSSEDNFLPLSMTGQINSNGDCEPSEGGQMLASFLRAFINLIANFLRALVNFLCLGVAGLPLGGVGLWLKHQRRRLAGSFKIYH